MHLTVLTVRDRPRYGHDQGKSVSDADATADGKAWLRTVG